MVELTCPGKLEGILLCTDGSPASQGAVNAALALARACGAKLFALIVLEVNPEFEAQTPDLIIQVEKEVLAPIQAEAAGLGVLLETRTRRCLVASSAIIQEAEDIKPDMIVMGRHGRAGLARLMMGSVTARVIGHSPYNVLVVPREAALAFDRLLVASDGSSYSDAAFREALAMAKEGGGRLLAVVVARDEAEFPMTLELTDRLQNEANRQGVPLETSMLQGQPDDAIVQTAIKNQVNLIIMGSHGRTGLTRLLMGSVTERTIGQASCPVLVVKRF
jgi:nucleotide-binding universal stress UspA family protein